MFEPDIILRLKSILPLTSDYFTESIEVLADYEDGYVKFDFPDSKGSEFMISDSEVRCRVIRAEQKLFRDDVTRCVELEFEGYLPFVFDIKESRLNTIQLTYLRSSLNKGVVTFPVLDINQETNKIYIKATDIPDEVTNLYYVGPHYGIHGIYTPNVDYKRQQNTVRFKFDQFFRYESIKLKIDYISYIHFIIQDDQKVRDVIATYKENLESKKCHIFVQPLNAIFVPRKAQQNDVGVVDFSANTNIAMRYLNSFDVTLMAFGFGTQEGLEPYEVLKECKDYVLSALTGFSPSAENKPYLNRPIYCNDVQIQPLATDRGVFGMRMNFVYFSEYMEFAAYTDYRDIMNINSFDLNVKAEDSEDIISQEYHNFKDYTSGLKNI
jgi:hypothetical protein